MSTRTVQSPLLAHQLHVAVADGAEEHASSVADGATPCGVGNLLMQSTVRQITDRLRDGRAFHPRFVPRNALPWKVQTDMPTQKLTPEIITAAILGFEGQKRHIDTQIAELRALLSSGPAETAAPPEPATRKRRKMSAAARKRIGDAQRKRWAESQKATEPPAPLAAPKPKRKLSKAGRAAIVAATKNRWAAIHKSAKPAKKET